MMSRELDMGYDICHDCFVSSTLYSVCDGI